MSPFRHNGTSDDGFWHISDLIPPKKSIPRPRPAQRDTEAVEVISAAPVCAAGTGTEVPLTERPVSPVARDAAPPQKPEISYRPAGGLIHEVRVYPWKNEYAYYEQFCRHARHFADREGSECPAVDFFSYMPQYSQMSRAQLAYYFWWRTNFQNGVCLDASYSYLLLYLYELINLENVITPQTVQENMLRLWLSYREKHPRLDVLVREWLCDFSLLHRLPPPCLPADSLRELLAGCRLKEFYVSAAEGEEAYCDAVLFFCSNYDYKKSKFYKPETAALFDKILRGAASAALAFLQEKNAENAPRQRGYSTIGRDAFSGAICSYRLKRHIEVDFSSFSHTHELRYVITDVLKYAENALRAALGIKSRLTVYEVGTELREVLDAYLRQNVPARSVGRKSEATPPPTYEQRYELPVRPLSLTNAAKIESASWQTTKRLVEAFEAEEEQTIKNPIPSPTQSPKIEPQPDAAPHFSAAAHGAQAEKSEKSDTVSGDFVASIGDLCGFIALAAAGDRAGQRAFALARGVMADAVADRINTLAEEMLGDIVLEDAGGYYTVIEEYEELLKEQGVL